MRDRDHEGVGVEAREGRGGGVWTVIFGTLEVWEIIGVKDKTNTVCMCVPYQIPEAKRHKHSDH